MINDICGARSVIVKPGKCFPIFIVSLNERKRSRTRVDCLVQAIVRNGKESEKTFSER